MVPVQVYTPAAQALLASELAAVGAGLIWPSMMVDYFKLRDAMAACKGIARSRY